MTVGGERLATETLRDPAAWLEATERGEPGEATPVAPADQATEYLMMSLRIAEGADLSRYARLAGAPLDPGRIAGLAESGHLVHQGGRIAATEAGRPLLNAVLRALLV